MNTSGPGRVESDLSVKTKTHFAFRVDIWDDTGDSIIEHVAGADDFEVAEATYRAAVARWPAARITLSCAWVPTLRSAVGLFIGRLFQDRALDITCWLIYIIRH
jgi:hypothetical protein